MKIMINYFKFTAASGIWILWFAVSAILCMFILAFVVLTEFIYYIVNFLINLIKNISIKVLIRARRNAVFKKAEEFDTSILKLPKYLLTIKKDKYGWTPIHYLAYKGVKEIITLDKELLIVKDNNGNTPIHLLAMSGVKEVLNLDKKFLSTENDDGNTPIHELADKGVKIPEKYKELI